MDIPKNYSTVIVSLIIGTFAILEVHKIFDLNFEPDYHWIYSSLNSPAILGYDVHVKYLLLKISLMTGFVKLFPFLYSIGVLIFSYLITVQLSGSRIGGIISVLIISSSTLFRAFDSSASYDYSWILFLLVGIYFSNRWFGFSGFVISLFCKPLTLFFAPSMIFLSLKNKRLGIVYLMILGISLVMLSSWYKFSLEEFIGGLSDWWTFLYIDRYMQFMIPLSMIAMVIMWRHGYKNTMIPFMFCLNSILTGAFVEGFTSMWNEPYRFVPLVVFFAIGTGTLFQSRSLNPKILAKFYKN